MNPEDLATRRLAAPVAQFPAARAAGRAATLRGCAALVALCLAAPLQAATFIVTSNADTAGSTCGSVCTLRQAINAANATPAADTINFAITLPPRGEILIQPGSSLPNITAPLTINGYSQAGTRLNDDAEFSNAILRIRVDGTNAGANSVGLAVCAADVTIRGLSITRFARGIAVGFNNANSNCTASNTAVHGNFLGLTTPGNSGLGNTTNTLARTPLAFGSAAPADRNVVAGNGIGLNINGGGAEGSTVEGNLFGTGKNGSGDFGGTVGIVVTDTTGLNIGNLARNRIRHYARGIAIGGSARGIVLAGIQIGASDLLGIDLGVDGLTPNDANDLDAGANDLQNFPVITAAQRVPTGVAISGTLDVGHPGSLSYQLRAYASPQCHPGGHGDGERFLGVQTRNFASTAEGFSYTQATTDALPPGTVITLTATRTGVGTSEFSACFPLDPPPLVVNTTSDTADGTCNAAHCSLRDAIIESNGFTGTGLRSIHFAIPPLAGSSEILIAPTSPLPSLTRGVLIDGYTQPGTSANTDPLASNAVLRIRIDGLNAGANSTAFNLCDSGISVRGLSITRFARAFNGCNGVDSVIAGNFIGLASDGVSAFGNSTGINSIGVRLHVGGVDPADRNLIAESNQGLAMQGAGIAGSTVLGNLFGSDRSGTLDRGNQTGVQLSGAASGVVIGSDSAPNRLAFSSVGINLLTTAGSANQLGANSFPDSGFLAIDLGGNGVTANDPGDGDSGPNGLQNFPVLTLAERTDSGLRLVGSFDSPVAGFEASVISVYASEDCVPAHGSADSYLGSFLMLGNAFDAALVTEVDLTQFGQISATVTRGDGTSEMSACIAASDPPPGIAVDSSDDLAPDGGCTVSGDANLCTLREAIALANAQPGADTIRFALPGDQVHQLSPATLLPVITGATTIDGLTQLGAVPNAAPEGSDAVLKVELRAIGLSHLLRICTSETVELRGLAMHGGSAATIATQVNDAGSCAAAGPLRIRGSWIGFRADGASAPGNLGVGATNSVLTFGGPALADRNVIGSNALAGLRILGSGANGSSIVNNVFGSEPDLLAGASNGRSVELLNTSDNVVGGDGGLANRFSGGELAIFVSGVDSDRNRLFGNRFIGQSGTTSIDLADGASPNGINPNDVNDVDTGANEGQNTPLLTAGSASATSITIDGVLDVPAGIATPVAYRLAFYRSAFCSDSSGIFGGRRGDNYLGSVEQPLASNAENFSITLPVTPAAGFITATATSPSGSTSEIGNCLAAPQPDPLHADGFE